MDTFRAVVAMVLLLVGAGWAFHNLEPRPMFECVALLMLFAMCGYWLGVNDQKDNR